MSEAIRLTQENLEQERKRVHSILSYMTDGVLATNRRGQIIMINDMAKRQLGVARDDALNQNILELLKIEEEYELRDLITQSPELMIYSQNVNGEYISLRVRFALIRRESGFISGLVAVLHDTTEQEKEERERRLFVSNVSHELRTPLTSVKSYLEALDEGALYEPVAPDFIKVSLDETNRMMRMVTDLLHLSRIDNATSHLDVELINFTAFITFILNRFDKIRAQDQEKKYELVRDYPITSVWIEIDTDKMTQVIDNILNNAIKYSPDGGKITVSMKTTDDQMILSISDQGLGIPKEDLPKIFTSLLGEINRKPEDLDAILITHEHADHIHGVGVLARKYGMDLYANEKTWQAMENSKYLGKVDSSQKHIFEMGKTKTFGDIDIESFGVSHDAVAPQFYRFMKDDKSFVMLTDTGYVSDRMAGIVENADGYLIESNHDVEILRAGSYAWRLKQRILSDLGHLSNEDGADAMIRTLGNRTKKIYLGHLSKENNIKELAHMTMVNQLAQADLGVGVDFQVYDTSPDTATPLTDI